MSDIRSHCVDLLNTVGLSFGSSVLTSALISSTFEEFSFKSSPGHVPISFDSLVLTGNESLEVHILFSTISKL